MFWYSHSSELNVTCTGTPVSCNYISCLRFVFLTFLTEYYCLLECDMLAGSNQPNSWRNLMPSFLC